MRNGYVVKENFFGDALMEYLDGLMRPDGVGGGEQVRWVLQRVLGASHGRQGSQVRPEASVASRQTHERSECARRARAVGPSQSCRARHFFRLRARKQLLVSRRLETPASQGLAAQ